MRTCILVLCIAFLIGCATFRMLADEAKQITSEEMQPYTKSVGALVSDMVPNRYKLPVGAGVGFVLTLLGRVIKKRISSQG